MPLAATCPSCTATAAGTKVLYSAAGPYYLQPAKLPVAEGTLAQCAPFQATGARLAVACAGQQARTCYAEWRDNAGKLHYVQDHLCSAGGGTSALGAPTHPSCTVGEGLGL